MQLCTHQEFKVVKVGEERTTVQYPMNEAYLHRSKIKVATREDGDDNLRNEEKDESIPSRRLCFARSSLSWTWKRRRRRRRCSCSCSKQPVRVQLCGHGEKRREEAGNSRRRFRETKGTEGQSPVVWWQGDTTPGPHLPFHALIFFPTGTPFYYLFDSALPT